MYVEGSIQIMKNPSITSATGAFPLLEKIGHELEIEENSKLKNLDGFGPKLASAKFTRIANNQKLKSMTAAFPGLTGGNLYLNGNTNLVSIASSFAAMTQIGYLKIYSCRSLTSIDATSFASLAHIISGLYIYDNQNIATLENAFPELLSITGAFQMYKLKRLQNLNAFGAQLRVVTGRFMLDAPYASEACSTLAKLHSSNGNDAVAVVHALQTQIGMLEAPEPAAAGAPPHTSDDGAGAKTAICYANPAPCSCSRLDRCNMVYTTKDVIEVKDAASARHLAKYDAVVGDVMISIPSDQGSDVELLFDSLVCVYGKLSIENNEVFLDFSQSFSALVGVEGSLRISSNINQENVAGAFAALEHVNGIIEITHNNKLKSLAGAFPLLSHSGTAVSINKNRALATIGDTAFPILASASSITISANGQLASLGEAFPQIEQVIGTLEISSLPLTSLDHAFSRLHSVNFLNITNNFGAFQLNENTFPSLSKVRDNIHIDDNAGLLSMNGCLAKLTIVKDDLHVKRNSELVEMIGAFPALTMVQDFVKIESNVRLNSMQVRYPTYALVPLSFKWYAPCMYVCMYVWRLSRTSVSTVCRCVAVPMPWRPCLSSSKDHAVRVEKFALVTLCTMRL